MSIENINIQEGEILLVDKPYRWTSFDVVGALRGVIRKINHDKKIKIGHAGTLDPLATGLLMICVGKATKSIEQFKDLDKEYTGTFVLGATTPSYDMEKEIDNTFPIAHITETLIYNAAKALSGEQMQVPPVFSAIKVNGRRAYESARKDQPLELAARKITIQDFEITRIELPEVDFRVVCSKGTYLRALARDFGTSLHSGAYLKALRRTRVGPFAIEQAQQVEELKKILSAQIVSHTI